jgi:hypothetical protein
LGFGSLWSDRPKYQVAPSMTALITAEECRRKAEKCIAESAKAHANFSVSADWLVLAELWTGMAEALTIEKDHPLARR